MIKSLIISAVAIVFMMLSWIVVQTIWRKVFTGNWVGEDVLAGRKGCTDCRCLFVCKDNKNKKLN